MCFFVSFYDLMYAYIQLVPHPKISITYKGSLSVGSHLLVNCTLKNYSVIDLDVSINFTWLRSGKVLSNDTDRVVLFNFKESPSTFTSQLSLSPLSAHDANITCLVTAHPATPTSFIDKSPTVDAHVQLSIEGIVIPRYSAYVCVYVL